MSGTLDWHTVSLDTTYMVPRSRSSFLSVAGMYTGLVLVALAAFLMLSRRSPKYWPLLAIGFPLGCISTPFYYYFKAKAKNADPYAGTEVQTLAHYGDELKKGQDGRNRT